jgi:hypothetical protein
MRLVLAPVLLFLVISCGTDVKNLECPGADVLEKGDQTEPLGDIFIDIFIDRSDLSVQLDISSAGKLVGAACDDPAACLSGECLTKEYMEATAAAAGQEWPWEIPGGMCSLLMCNLAPEGVCGEGAICFDVGQGLEAGMPVGICLNYCDEYSDCRFQEGYVCYFTGVDGQRACLPSAIVADISCGDGQCEAPEGPATCPRDCQ